MIVRPTAVAVPPPGAQGVTGQRGDVLVCRGGNDWRTANELIGWDTVREPVTILAVATTGDAANLPAIPRDAQGTPLEVDLGEWTFGDVLCVEWFASSVGLLSPGANGNLAPLVLLGDAGPFYIDNASQLGLVGVPGSMVYAFGGCAIALQTEARVRVRLGLGLVQGAPGDFIIVEGGPMTYVGAPIPVVATTWLKAYRIAAERVAELPPVQLRSLPVPS